MRVTRISHLTDLTSCYVDDWNRLAGNAPFIGWTWMSAWWKHYGTAFDLYVLIVEDDDGTVVGIAPWFLEASPARGRRIKFLGTGHVCSDYLRLLVRDQDIDQVTSAIADWLKAANAVPIQRVDDAWDFLSFEGIQQGEPTTKRLRKQFQLLGNETEFDPTIGCWRTTLPKDWNTYVMTLTKKSRRKVRDMRKKYIDADRTEFKYASTFDEFEDFYESFVQLHQKRRHSVGEPGCFSSPSFASFIRDVAGQYFQQKKLLISRLTIDGTIAASSLGVLADGIHYMYQSGFDTDLSHLNPGWVMNVHSILYAVDHDLTAIDYMRGDEPYKAKLGAELVEMVKFRIVANQARAKIRNKVWQMRTNIKQNGLGGLPFQWSDMLGSQASS